MLKGFFRVAPGLSIIAIFQAIYWSPIYPYLSPDIQTNIHKLFLSSLGVVMAHWLGKALFPAVDNWNDTDQPYIKIARIALYVAMPISITLGG